MEMHEHIIFDNSQEGKTTSGRDLDGILDGSLSIEDIIKIKYAIGEDRAQYFRYTNVVYDTHLNVMSRGDLLVYSFKSNIPFLVGRNIRIPVS